MNVLRGTRSMPSTANGASSRRTVGMSSSRRTISKNPRSDGAVGVRHGASGASPLVVRSCTSLRIRAVSQRP